MSYCSSCGQEETVKIFTGRFSSKTGEKSFVMYCPDSCKHGTHRYETIGHGWLWYYSLERCVMCGKTWKDYGQ